MFAEAFGHVQFQFVAVAITAVIGARIMIYRQPAQPKLNLSSAPDRYRVARRSGFSSAHYRDWFGVGAARHLWPDAVADGTTRLVHVISAPVWYLGRHYQVVRKKTAW